MVLLYAVSDRGPLPLPSPPDARDVHQLFDALPRGVYSGLRSYQGDRLLHFDRHLDRTEQSMRLSGLDAPLDRQRLRHALRELLDPQVERRIRFDVLGEPLEVAGLPCRMVLGLAPYQPVPASVLEHGAGLGIAHGLRRARPLIKTTDFVIERRPHERPGCYEQVMLDERGRMLECVSSNLWAVEGGRIFTAGDGVLEGVTRGIVLSLAGEMGVEVVFEPVAAARAAELDEAFLTSSTREVVPVTRIGQRAVGGGRPGPITRALAEAYRAYAARHAAAP